MARIAPQTSLPGGDPDSLLASSPPGALLMVGTNGLQITVAVSAGSVTCAPYFWDGTSWVPLQGDTIVAPLSCTANAATVAVAHDTWARATEPRFFAVLKTGGGTLTYCDLAEAVL